MSISHYAITSVPSCIVCERFILTVHVYICINIQFGQCVCFVSFVALRPKSTAMVMAGWSVHTFFPGQA